ncbi:MAG: aspartyl/asparaginyl beta-hydroxylase domain-containing protein [Chitinophaga sp.]
MQTTLQKPAFDTFPYSFLRDLESQFENIRNEYRSVASQRLYMQWPETFLYNEGWNVFGLRFAGKNIESAHAICPAISAFINRHDSLIETAGFSILEPGTIIKPHVGYTDRVLRCHLGIQIPEGDCRLRVAGIEKKWKEGEAFIFDDTFVHDAWNKTGEVRIVMLLDLVKEVLAGGDQAIHTQAPQ